MTPSPYNAVLQQNLLTALMIQQAIDLTHRVCFAFVKVQKELESLPTWKSPGLDGLPNIVLKKCSNVLAPPLHHILHLSLEQGTYPEQWKTAVVSPIFKQKGNRSDPKFYRPISLLSSVSKVFERLVHKQLMEFCFENTVFPDCQLIWVPTKALDGLATVVDYK